MDTVSEERLKLIFPPLADRIRRMSVTLAAEDIFIRVVQGQRTVEEQHELFLKGRDATGKIVNKALVVTNADGGHSYHNYGLAVDCAPDDPTKEGYQPDWNASHPSWKRMVEVGISLGLESGAKWIRLVDAPHFQLTGRFPVGAPTDEMRQLYKTGGIQAVWDAVSASLAPA